MLSGLEPDVSNLVVGDSDFTADATADLSGLFASPDEVYPSAYQPPPLRTKDVLEMSLESSPPQSGQDVSGSSDIF